MKKPKFIPEFKDIPTPRTKMAELPVEERRGNFVEVEKGFTEEQALAEARRCLSCRRCIGCGLCLAECDRKAIVYDDQPRTFNFGVDAVILAPGFETFNAGRKRNLGYGNAANVVTSIEYERILSPTGPFGGRLLRPLDGEVPRRVAIIQCVGCREEALGASYCSTICCMNAIKMAQSTRERIPDAEVVVFHRTIRPWGPGSEKYYMDAREDSLIRFVEGDVGTVKEIEDSGSLSLSWSIDGREETEEFDLVVLSVAMASSRSAKGLARKVRAKTDKYGFCLTDPFTPLSSTTEGVLVAGAFSGPKDIGVSVCQATGAAASVLASLGHPAFEGTDKSGDASGSVESPSTSGDGTAVLLCRYGLRTLGIRDLNGLMESLSGNPGVQWVTEDEFLCRALRRTTFREEIAKRGIGTLLVTCYGSTHQALFDHAFRNDDEKPSIRVIDVGASSAATAGWVADRVEEELAGRVSENDRGAGYEVLPRIAVVGGGPAGMSAAINLADGGRDVDLISAGGELGGRLRRLKPAPGDERTADEITRGMIETLKKRDRITVHVNTRVTGISGEPGAFRIVGSRDGTEATFHSGAVILAMGAADYEPTEFPGDGRLLTQGEMENRLTAGPVDSGKVVMIQCVGSRTTDYPVCSQICCAQAIRNALALRAAKPETEVTILHQDIRVFGLDEDLYVEAIEKGVVFVKVASPPTVAEGDLLRIDFADASGERKTLDADLVVLSTGLRPCEGATGIAREAGIGMDEFGFFKPLERNFRPVESSRSGIFVCGLATGPKTLSDCIVEGLAAAGRAAAFLGSRKPQKP